MKPTVYSLRPTVSGLLAAFTLVELMVVVAIVSILLMLLIPNIRTMREKAWSSNCQNNLRQFGVAMNQYMADYNGYFIYPGFGVGETAYELGGDAILPDYQNRPVGGTTVGGAAADYWGNFVTLYLGPNVTLASLSAGEPSVRVCPVILRELHNDNYFDPLSPGFKGFGIYQDDYIELLSQFGDFESVSGAGYDADTGNLNADYASNYTSNYLDTAFTTYAINPVKYKQASSNCPASVIAFIDWNAREGWNANLNGSTGPWSYNCPAVSNRWMFSGTNAAGTAIVQGTPKWTSAWWLTEVGFHHLQGNVYGANYVAMDGHVGWVGSNAISTNLFY